MYDAMYPQHILDHGTKPRNRGRVDPADAEYEGTYRLCGDRLRLTLQYDDQQRITALGWDGEGCAISQASASMLGERIIGKTLDDVRLIGKQDIFVMLGIPLPSNREKCALLPFKVLIIALYGQAEWLLYESDDEEL
jgi:nitrogen fixation NifU-like protein